MAVIAIAAGLIAWAMGVHPAQSAFVATAVATLGAGYGLRPLAPDVAWPQSRHNPRHGTRSEVSRLSWGLTDRDGVVSPRAVQRMRVLAERRLWREGVDLHDPTQTGAAERLLGTRALRVILAGADHPVRHADAARCIAALEQLDDRRATPPTNPPPGDHLHRLTQERT